MMMHRTMSGLNSLESIRDTMESTDVQANINRPEFSRILAYGMWDNPDLVLQGKGRPVGSGKLLQQFLTKLEAVEERYAKDLYALSSAWPVSRFAEGPALFSAFAQYVVMTRQRAELHGKQAELLKRVTQGKTLEASDSMLEKPCKEVAAQIKESGKQLKKVHEQLAAAVKAMQKMEEASVKKLAPHERAGWRSHLDGKRLTKLRDLEKQLHEAEVADAMVTEVHNQCVGRGLDSVQALEYRRVSTLLHAVFSSVDHLTKMTAAQWKAATQSVRQIKHVNWDTDLKKWVDKHSSGAPCPFAATSTATAAASSASIANIAAAGSHVSMSGATALTNPFSRRSQLRLGSRFSEQQRQRTESKVQAQAQKDAAKFVKLLKMRQKKEQQLKLRAQRSENQALREEQKQQSAAQADLEQRIREVTEAKTREVSAKEALLVQLMAEKEAADREREELRVLLQEKEEELNAKGSSSGGGGGDVDVELKRPIIIDAGSAYLKVGFSGQRSPMFVVPNVCAHFPHPLAGTVTDADTDTRFDRPVAVFGSTTQHIGAAASADQEALRVNAQVYSDQPASWADVQAMYEYVFAEMGVDPREHPFLITQPSMAPHSLKQRTVELFFETFKAPALYVATAPVLSAYAYGSSSGLVVDCGHSSCQVVPLIDGYLLEPHVQRAFHLGGRKDTLRLSGFLQRQVVLRAAAADSYSGARVVDSSIKSLVTATSIKDRLAVCTPSADNYANMVDILQAVRGFTGRPDADPAVAVEEQEEEYGGGGDDDDDAQAVPLALQEEMLKCGEVMFRPRELLNDHDDSIVSIPEMIAKVVRRCDVDTRRTLLSNVFLSGGVPTMPGFKERLDAELRHLIPQANEYLSIQDSESAYAAWVGGSVLSGLVEFQEQWVFLEEWEEARDALDHQEPRFTLDDMRKEHLINEDDDGGGGGGDR